MTTKKATPPSNGKDRSKERVVHAVDLDGTLAMSSEHDFDPSVIGELVPAMADRVRKWREAGEEVVIFTARVSGETPEYRDIEKVRGIIEDWCEEQFGERFRVTAEKSYLFHDIWDDRAVQVITDTGQPLIKLVKQLRIALESATGEKAEVEEE